MPSRNVANLLDPRARRVAPSSLWSATDDAADHGHRPGETAAAATSRRQTRQLHRTTGGESAITTTTSTEKRPSPTGARVPAARTGDALSPYPSTEPRELTPPETPIGPFRPGDASCAALPIRAPIAGGSADRRTAAPGPCASSERRLGLRLFTAGPRSAGAGNGPVRAAGRPRRASRSRVRGTAELIDSAPPSKLDVIPRPRTALGLRIAKNTP